jgi:hypothetical protein
MSVSRCEERASASSTTSSTSTTSANSKLTKRVSFSIMTNQHYIPWNTDDKLLTYFVCFFVSDDSDWTFFGTIGNAMESEHCLILYGIE